MIDLDARRRYYANVDAGQPADGLAGRGPGGGARASDFCRRDLNVPGSGTCRVARQPRDAGRGASLALSQRRNSD